MKRRAMVIAYDITDNKRRRKLFRVLKSWKLSAQYSVFECKLTRVEASELFLQLTDLLNEEKDMLLLARLDSSRKSKGLTQCSGIGFKVPVLYMG